MGQCIVGNSQSFYLTMIIITCAGFLGYIIFPKSIESYIVSKLRNKRRAKSASSSALKQRTQKLLTFKFFVYRFVFFGLYNQNLDHKKSRIIPFPNNSYKANT